MTGAVVVATVGSDHHPFDRLIRWVDRWAAAHPDADVWCQYGTSAAPVHAAGERFAAADDLLARIAGASAVVTAAGPGTVMEIRAAGTRPIVVPRRSSLEEHVDDHQRAFARTLADAGVAVVCDRAPDLWRVLDTVAADPSWLRLPPGEATAEPPGRARVAAVIEALARGRGR